MNTNQSYKELISRIKKVRTTQNIIDFGASILSWAGIASLIIVLSISVEYFANGDESFRKFLFYSSLSTIGVSFLASIFRPILRILSEEANYKIPDLALKIGDSYPEIKDRLLNAMQLKRTSSEGKSSSNDLAESAFDSTYKSAKDKDFSVILDKSGLKKSLVFLLVGAAAFFSTISISENFQNAGSRVLKYDKSFLPPIPFKLYIADINSNIKRGSDISLKIKGEGQLPETVELHLKEAKQGEFNSYKLRLDTGNTYKFSIKSLKTSLSYFAKGKYLNQSTFSDTSKISVFDLPFVKMISGRVDFPSYARISPQLLSNNNADITGLLGSEASFEISANTKLDSAKIEFISSKSVIDSSLTTPNDSLVENTESYPMSVKSETAKGSFRIKKSGTYKFRLYSDGLINENPIEYRVLALKDDNPTITLVQPKSDVQLNSKAILPIVVDVSDDYGLGKLYLNYKLTFSKYVDPDKNFQKVEISYKQKGKSIEIPYVWNLNEIGISPEDKFEFFLEIFDNDVIGGPKSAKTPILKLRLPSLDEAFEEAEVAQKEIENELDEVLKESQELNEKIEELKNDLRKDAKKKKMDWQQQKESKDIFNKREDLKEKVEDLSQKLDQTSKQMQDNEMLSKETLEKYQKLQELMQEVSRPDLKAKSQEIKQKLDKMTPEQMRKALEQSQLNDEQFQQQIERSMKMLKKIQAEQKMDEISKKAKEMQQEQKSIEDALNKENLSKKEQNKLKNQQKALQDKLKDIEQEMKELSDLIKESGDEQAAKDFEQAVNKLNPEQTKDDLQKAEQKMDEAFQKQNESDENNQQNSENQQQNQQNKNQQNQQQQQSQQQMKQQANQAKQQAQQKQQNAQKKMSEFAQKMQEMKQKMQQKAMEKMMKDMKKSISDLLQLSQEQEQLKDQTQGLNNNSNKLPDIQNKQGDLNQSLNSVGKKLMEMSQQSFEVSPEMGKEISKAMREMGESAKDLSERRPSSSAKNQKQSMTALNKAAMQMQSGLQKMKQAAQQQAGQQQPGGPGMGEGQGQGQKPSPSLGQQLQQAAAQQQLLKQSMQQMMQQQKKGGGKQPGGQGGSGGESGQNPQDKKTGQYGRLKNEVGNAQKSLEELAEEQKKSSGGNEKMESELRKISKEMQEIMSDIESGNVNDKTLEKQERILSRLLDASRSVNERDKQKKREAKSGKDYSPQSPSDIDWDSRQRKKQLEDMLKQLEAEYTKDYELIIKKYFEELKKTETE